MEKLLKQCQVMAESTDVIVASIVLQEFIRLANSSIKALELGAGSGGWPRIINKLGATNIDWILLEDFSWVKQGYFSIDYYWPYNKEDLLRFNHELDASLHVEEVIDKQVDYSINSGRLEKYEKSISAVRIDCDISFKEALYIIENSLVDNGVIIIDDCRINCGLNRIVLMLSLIENKHAYPVWFGSKESMICKSKEYADYLQNIIAKKIDEDYADSNISYNLEYKNIYNQELNYITTANFKIYNPFKGS